MTEAAPGAIEYRVGGELDPDRALDLYRASTLGERRPVDDREVFAAMLEHANLLVFDEPTNHLDVESIEALEDALADYDGTVLLVSHDRALLDTLTTRIWSIEDGQLRDYPGGFADWEEDAAARGRERAARTGRRRCRDDHRE